MNNTEKAEKLEAAAEAIRSILQDKALNIRIYQSIDGSTSPYILLDYGFDTEQQEAQKHAASIVHN